MACRPRHGFVLSLSIVALVAASLQRGHAQGDLGPEGLNTTFVDYDTGAYSENENVAELLVFPFCRCIDYRCASSPWKLIPSVPVASPDDANVNIMCFNFMHIGCAFQSTCCSKLERLVDKVEFAVDKTCQKQVINVTYNGVSIRGNSYFDTQYPSGKLRVTSLDLQGKARIINSTICLWVRSPCNSLEGLMQNHDGTFQAKPKADCDCISVYAPNTRWRFAFRKNNVYQDKLYWSFMVWAVPSEHCSEATWRTAMCCDQTLDTIEVSLDMTQYNETYWRLANEVWLLQPGGSLLKQERINTLHWSQMGLIFQKFGDLRPDDYPPGKELVLTLALNTSMHNSLDKFPCGLSKFVDEPVCDYALHGQQVMNGQVINGMIRHAGVYKPDCCPDGVFDNGPAVNGCGCVDDKLDSPYRINLRNPTLNSGSGTTQWNLRIMTVLVDLPVREPNAWDCTNHDIDKIRLYVRPEVVDQVHSVLLNRQPCNFSFGADDYQTWIDIKDLGLPAQPAGTMLDLQIVAKDGCPDVPSFCAANPLGTSECEYVLYGNWDLYTVDYTCCIHGFSDSDPILQPLPAHSCDANVLHSPYSVDFQGISRRGNTSTITFEVAFKPNMCDADDHHNNNDCCDHDVKKIFLALDGSSITRVFTQPDLRPLLTPTSEGVEITGKFGQGFSFNISMEAAGHHSIETLSKGVKYAGDGFKYRLYGGSSLCRPLACCPSYFTGDGTGF